MPAWPSCRLGPAADLTQLAVVVVLEPGRRLAQAASAFLTTGLSVLSVVGGTELALVDDLAGKLTPWFARQLR